MSFFRIKTLAVVFTIAAAVSAQFYDNTENARMRALSGAPLGDITDIYGYPVLMTGYTDHLQATWGGSVIGIKSVSDMFSIGLTANQGPVAPGIFGAAAGSIGVDRANVNVPHLLLGFDLGAAQLGADVFFEYARYYEDIAAATETNTSRLFINPGARLSVAIDLGSAGLLAKFGMGFPAYNETIENIPGGTNVNPDVSGIYMEVGAEVGLPVGDIDVAIGGDYTYENRSADGSQTTNINSLIELYANAGFNVLETAAAAAGYTFTRSANTAKTEVSSSTSYVMVGRQAHIFSFGAENVWADAWILDAFQLRAGALYGIGIAPRRKDTNSNNGQGEWEKNYAAHAVSPSIGIGVSKSFLTLDLALDMGSYEWAGLFSGPPVGLATATIKF